MKNLHTENLLKMIEVSIPMQEYMVLFQAKGSNQAINGLSYGETATPQNAVVSGGCDCSLGTIGRERLEV